MFKPLSKTTGKINQQQVTTYILDMLEVSLEDYTDLQPLELLQEGFTKFTSEYQHEINRLGFKNALTSYLQGLGFSIDYINCEILSIGKNWNAFEGYTDKKLENAENKFIDNWFAYISQKLSKLWEINNIL